MCSRLYTKHRVQDGYRVYSHLSKYFVPMRIDRYMTMMPCIVLLQAVRSMDDILNVLWVLFIRYAIFHFEILSCPPVGKIFKQIEIDIPTVQIT